MWGECIYRGYVSTFLTYGYNTSKVHIQKYYTKQLNQAYLYMKYEEKHKNME